MFYRKKTAVIEAMQLNAENQDEVAEWCEGVADTSNGVYIKTLEGEMRASEGDFVIKGVNGEFYPCKPDIFEKTYEPA